MGVDVTGYLLAGVKRADVEAFVGLVRAYWEEGLVAPRAALSVGPLKASGSVHALDMPGADREVRWEGTDLDGLLAAIREVYDRQDVAVFFPTTTVLGFASDDVMEEYIDEDDPHGMGGEWDDDAPPAACLCSAAKPVKVNGTSEYDDEPRPLGKTSTWAEFSGAAMCLMGERLEDCRFESRMKRALGRLRIGLDRW